MDRKCQLTGSEVPLGKAQQDIKWMRIVTKTPLIGDAASHT